MGEASLSLSVWFVCRLCRGSFGQVDAFIEHKKQKHFNEFQNTTCIVFEETEPGELCPIISKAENQVMEVNNEPLIKIEVNDDEPSTPFSWGITDEPNVDLLKPKSELITYESEINPDNENNFFGLKQPEQNPYVLLKRLTTEEIKSACGPPQHHSTLLKCEQNDFMGTLEPPSLSSDVDSNTSDKNKVEKCTENQSSLKVGFISTEDALQFECKLCSKQLQTEAQLKIHVGICALYHEDRNRFCVSCNRKFCDTQSLKDHRLRFHGTDEEKLSVYKFKCHVCPKQYQRAIDLRCHVESHKGKDPELETSTSKLRKCSHPNCGKTFRCNSELQRHISAVHLRLRPFSCSFPKCSRTFTERTHLKKHFVIHTGEHPYKCTVDNCNETFMFSSGRSRHRRKVHRR